MECDFFSTEEVGDDVCVVKMKTVGGLQEDEARVRWDQFMEEAEKLGGRHMVVDLSETDYFGSIILELIVVLWKGITANHKKLCLCNVSDTGLGILKTAKFDSIWEICADRESALRLLRS